MTSMRQTLNMSTRTPMSPISPLSPLAPVSSPIAPLSPMGPLSPMSPLSQTANYYNPPPKPKLFNFGKCISNMFWWYNSINKDIIIPRMIKAIFWSIIVQIVFLILFIFSVNFNLLHPLDSLSSAFKTSTSLTTWLLINPLAILIAIEGVISSEDILLHFPYSKTNFGAMCKMFSLRNLIMLTFHTFSGGIIFWLYLTLFEGDFSSISIPCENELCFQDRTLFLRISGFLMGAYFFFNDYFFENKTLQFPVIQYYKFLQFKPKIIQAFKKAMFDVLLPMLLIISFYYINGTAISRYFVALYGYNPDEKPLSNLLDFFNLKLLLNFWILSIMFLITIYSVKIIFNLYFTEQISFPIAQKSFAKESFLLKHALASEFPIIQHLGYLDLMNLAEKLPNRREDIFTLSQPGGHPHNWNEILEQILNLINTYTQHLSLCNTDTPICEFILPTSTLNQSTFDKESLIEKEDETINKTLRNLTFDNTAYEFSYADNLKNNRIDPFLKTQYIPKVVKKEINIVEDLQKKSKQMFNKIIQYLLNKPGFHFLFAKHPEAEMRYYLLRAQPVIWALQALSLLVAASYNQDKYGIVQKDLAKIISSFLKLKTTLDKLQKTPFNNKRSCKNTTDIKMKLSLKSAVKRSLYRISNIFGSHVNDISLNKDDLLQFEKFIMFKE